jgi:hypothetical protein
VGLCELLPADLFGRHGFKPAGQQLPIHGADGYQLERPFLSSPFDKRFHGVDKLNRATDGKILEIGHG